MFNAFIGEYFTPQLTTLQYIRSTRCKVLAAAPSNTLLINSNVGSTNIFKNIF